MKLSYSVVGAAEAPRTAIVLHGILGSGRNWRMFTRRMADQWPEWRFVLPDLRNHGESHPAPPPHDLQACAADLFESFGAVDAVIGHSFGGKVAAIWAGEHLRPDGHAWILDAVPGLPMRDPEDEDHEIARVLAAVRRVVLPVPSHEALQRQLEAEGFSAGLAGWMTTNLRRGESGLVWRFDLAKIPEMLASYWTTDAWPALHAAAGAVHIVRAGRSDRWTPDDVSATEEWARGAPSRRFVHVIPDAGHWVHVDAPDALLGLFAQAFER
jgi:esterase